MIGKSTNVFASKEYCLLCWMAEHQMDTASGLVVKFSQVELAKEYGNSPATINKWLTALRKVKCIEAKKRGSYRVTNTGHKVIAQMEKIEKLVGGK